MTHPSSVVHSTDARPWPSRQPSPAPAALSPLTHGIYLPVHPNILELKAEKKPNKKLKRNDAT
jgi:hypothetical protein